MRAFAATFLTLIMMLFAIMSPARAQFANREPGLAYGERIVREGAFWPGELPQGSAGPEVKPPPEDAVPAEAYERAVEELEAAAGPYARGLEEPLATLGLSLASRQRWAEAAGAYRRALHVLRVNDGLQSDAQGRLVGSLLGLYRAAADFEALDGQYDYYFRLYGRGEAALSERGMAATLQYLSWQREALRRELDDNPDDRLLDLYNLTEDLIDKAVEDEEVTAAQRQALALSQLKNLYLIQQLVLPEVDPMLNSSRQPFPPPRFDDVDPRRDRLETLRRSAFALGRELLSAQLEASLEVEVRGSLLRELGDWLQWHGLTSRAATSYSEAIALLAAAGRDDLVEQWWGAPVELPDNGVFRVPVEDGDESALGLARFEVSASGRARRTEVEILRGSDSKAIVLGRALRGLRFRPRFRGKEAVASPSLERRYLVLR